MVRDQVKVLTESQGKMARAVDVLRSDMERNMASLGSAIGKMSLDVSKLAGLVEALAVASDDHDARLSALEKKAKR